MYENDEDDGRNVYPWVRQSMFIICPGREAPIRYQFVFMAQKAFLEYLYFNILMNIFSRDMKFWKSQKFWNVPKKL